MGKGINNRLASGLDMRAKLVLGAVVTMGVVIATDMVSSAWTSYHLYIAVSAGLITLLITVMWSTSPWSKQKTRLNDYFESQGELAEKISESELMMAVIEAITNPVNELDDQMVAFATNVNETANSMSNSVALTNQGVTHQKSEAADLNHALDTMLSSSESVSKNARDATEAATAADSSARQGVETLDQATQAINSLASQVDKSSAVIQELAEDSVSIGAILDTIKGIAEQTNLLALNAAIEAARAGEQGRGFAVVADEVRALASRTHESTQEIETMIQKLQLAAKTAVSSMDGGQETAQTAVEQLSHATQSLTEITAAVESIRSMNSTISESADQQVSLTQDVQSKVEVIDDVCELTIETLEGLNSLSENLETLSSSIQDTG
ncbi:Methyl-accepting chemotaxis sensor/transducer protein [hydrothermal vent metagenome]|uniref:Methyl-accepting chemotaxis sensor/transducer protein n=1 Tax=hydrothermal vent metagenome TaxID=652676 RepID=A0A3B1A1S3_9ZZZZ